MRQEAQMQPSESKLQAVIYSRVSSKDQEREGFSIPAQETLLREYARQKGFVVMQEFVDVETAKETGRRGFMAMVQYLQAHHQQCRTVLVEKTDRLYRNLKDHAIVEELDLDLHFVKEGGSLNKDSRSSDKLLHGIRTVLAKNYSDNLSEEVKKGLRTKAAQQLWPSFAPLGYLNQLGADGKRIIVPDPIRGHMVTQLFEWFATGEYSLKRLAKQAYEAGFRFRKTNHKIPVATLHKTLRKRIYTGEFDYGGVRYQGSHLPLVARDTWERVQEILDGRHEKKHRKVRHAFAFSGLVRCGHCGCSMVGELKKKRYVYYHCTGYRGRCSEPYTREERLSGEFARQLRDLIVPTEVLAWLQNELIASDQKDLAVREQTRRHHQLEIERLDARLNVLYEDRLDGRIEAAMYDKKSGEIRSAAQKARQRLADFEAACLPPVRESVEIMDLVGKAAALFISQPASEQHKLLQLVLQEAAWQYGELRMSFREPFAQLQLSNRVTECKNSRFENGKANFDIWRRGGDSNPR